MRLLLDEHLGPALADALVKRGVDAVALTAWHDGRYLEASDEAILTAGAADHRVLVTYDQRTIPPLLRLWGEGGRGHAGVVFIDHRTIAPNDIGGLVRALVELQERLGELDWSDRTVFLRRDRRQTDE